MVIHPAIIELSILVAVEHGHPIEIGTISIPLTATISPDPEGILTALIDTSEARHVIGHALIEAGHTMSTPTHRKTTPETTEFVASQPLND